MDKKTVNICGFLFNMILVDGGVLFSKKDSFYSRVMFEYKSNLWRISEVDVNINDIPLCHIISMKDLLDQHIGADYEVKYLKFR